MKAPENLYELGMLLSVLFQACMPALSRQRQEEFCEGRFNSEFKPSGFGHQESAESFFFLTPYENHVILSPASCPQ